MPHPVARDTLPGVFSTTHWSVILSVGVEGSSTAMAALDRLCTSYWPPLYAYVRRCGRSPEDARDLTQAFFARLIENNRVALADPARGRFRTFLLGSMQNFLRGEHERNSAVKRGGGKEFISLDAQQAEEERYSELPSDQDPPDKLFERRWASRLIEVVLHRLRSEFLISGRTELFDALEPHLWGDPTSIPYTEIATSLNVTVVGIKSTTHRLRKRFREILRSEIAHTVEDPSLVDQEIMQLMQNF